MKILVISLAGIGDTLFATPLIHELRANHPDATIDALVMWPGSRQVLEGNPHLNTIHHHQIIQASTGERLRLLRPLRAAGDDVSFSTHPQSGMPYRIVARYVGAKIRLSHTYECSGWLDNFLVNRTIPQDYSIHCAENNLALLGLVGLKPKLARHEYELFFTEAEEKWAADYMAQHGLAGRKLLGLHVGSGPTKNLPLRRWPVAHYVDLIKRLNRERQDVSVLLFGGPEEKEAHATILGATNSPLVLQPDSKNIRQAAALLKRCRAFLSVDTVLMHLAAVAKVPNQIIIETPTFNKTVEPYGQKFVLVPNPVVAGRNLEYYRYDGGNIRGTDEELRQVMASVTADAVYAAVRSALA